VKNPKAALTLESLEAREVPSAVTWTGNGSSLYWSDNGNWNTNHHPVSGDSVSIPAHVNSFQDIANLKLGNLTLNGGDTVALNEPLTLDGSAASDQILGQGSGQNLVYGGSFSLVITGGDPIIDVPGGSSLDIAAQITGNGSVDKIGSGTLEFDNDNFYNGNTLVSAGVLALNDPVGNSHALPNSTLTIGEGTVTLLKGNQLPDSASIDIGPDSRLDLNGFSDTVGPLTVFSGSSITTGTGTLTLNGGIRLDISIFLAAATVTGNINLGTTDQVFNVLDSAPGCSLVLDGVISGGPSGWMIKTGPGLLELDDTSSLPNPYGGLTWVRDGTLALNDNGSDAAISNRLEIGDGTGAGGSAVVRLLQAAEIPVSAAVTIHSDGLLDLNGRFQMIGPLTLDGGAAVTTGTGGTLFLNGDVGVTSTGTAAATITGHIYLGTTDRTFTVPDLAAGKDLVINGLISGTTGGLVKDGAGTLDILGTVTATGTTTVNAGSLWLDTTQSSSPVVVTGGTLNGTGTAGPVNATGGTVAPGDGTPGTLSTGDLTLGAATFAPALGGAAAGQFGRLAVTGSVTLSGAVLAPVLTFTPTPGQQFEVVANDGADPVSGTFGNLPEGATFPLAGGTFQVTYHGGDGNDVVLTDIGPGSPPPPPPPPVTPPGTTTHLIATAADAGGPGAVVAYTATGKEAFTLNPFPGVPGGIRVATADVNGDGTDDVVAATGPGGPGLVAVFDGATHKELFRTQPFESSFTGGLYVAAGDLNGDGRADVVVTPDEGGGPRVTVFDGFNFARVADFLGIDDPNFRGGARAAVGNVAGKGYGDLIVAAGFQGGPRVAGYDGKSVVAGKPQHVFGDFFAFEPTLRNGVFLAAGDVDGDGYADLIAGGGPGGGPRVLVVSGRQLLDAGAVTAMAAPVANFFAGDVANRGGIRVAAKDLDGDNHADVVVGAGTGAGSRVTAYRGRDLAAGSTTAVDLSFDAFPGFAGGVFVG
jgi:autotransporter-associated beta strand protein